MPLTDLANQEIPEGLNDLAANFNKSFPSSYEFAKTFVQNSKSAAGGGNGVTSLDDPTYLGFNIRFDIKSPLFEGALEGNPGIPAGQNPDSFEGGDAGEVGSHPAGDSAVGYLNKIGEVNRATYLKAFCQGLREIQTTRPYYFQTIEGLQEAFNKTVTMTPYGGAADGEGITVGLLEAIDLKMSALFNLYKAACYDVKYRRTVLPINLMYFTCYVDVIEIRKFRSVKSALDSFVQKNLAKFRGTDNPNDELSKFVNENASRITLRFDECLWDVTASGQVFADVTNVSGGGTAFATSSMKWGYGAVEAIGQFAGYDSTLIDSAQQKPKTFGDLAKAAGKKLFDKTIQGATNIVQRKALSFLQGLKLGNVYGFGNTALNAINNPQGLISTLQGAAAQEATAPGFQDNLDANVYEGELPPGGSTQTLTSSNIMPAGGDRPPLTETNIFGPAPSGPPSLDRTNIFE